VHSGPSIEGMSFIDLELIRRLTTSRDTRCVHSGSNVELGFRIPPDPSIDETTTHSSLDPARMVQEELSALHRSPSNSDSTISFHAPASIANVVHTSVNHL